MKLLYSRIMHVVLIILVVLAGLCFDSCSSKKGNDKVLLALLLGKNGCFSPGVRSFKAGSIIIPMDTTYQDTTMFSPYGLIYQLLDNGIPIYWSIKEGKSIGETDFVASFEDYSSGTPVADYGYRGGPFIINSTEAAVAAPIIDNWKLTHSVTIHKTTKTVRAPIARRITTRPRIAVFADGNELIAFRLLNAAGIPDSTGQAWPTASDATYQYAGYPDVLDPDEIAGASYLDHQDGALFNTQGVPAYTHLLVMHWATWDDLDPNAGRNNEAVAEMRMFLDYPTHLVACCLSIIAIENCIHGKFLTDGGFSIGTTTMSVDYYHADNAQCQLDGAFGTVGGNLPTFSLAADSSYNANTIVMMTEAGTPAGTKDIWVTGPVDNSFSMNYKDRICPGRKGIVSYLGGHSYPTSLPISSHPDSQGTRLILNALVY